MEKCKITHDNLDKEMAKIKDDIKTIKDSLDTILEKIKPTFDNSDKIKMVIFLITYTFVAYSFMIHTDNRSLSNLEKINLIKDEKKEDRQKLDKIYDIVVQTQTDVAVLKSK